MTDSDGPDLMAFRDALDARQAAVVDEVHRTIAEAAPGLVPPIRTGSMLGYGRFHYRYDSGREGDAHLISLRGGSRQLSIYVSAVEDGRYLPEAHVPTLGKVSVGRSCIKVTRSGDLDLAGFADVVRRAVELGGEGQVR
ncbi:DUF1801 domain-containing protein [Actinomycetospora termitidis]|uniref:DUF1801 domain-containing protein n=1 Tax=Actinomycetospora termitidis TaxID=3053470 RepID=A0ABT7MBQ6_9PSEU|nr:DUF1801 domain-containing protein [Actinomycetospora sp. Odt1-22]MDL5158108.1 DUF1801 domain-containing protein [Actinomycetospora sp. Odt1-22]